MQVEEQIETTSAEVKPLGKLLEYQDGSIVSRVLLKNNGGTGSRMLAQTFTLVKSEERDAQRQGPR